MYCNLGATPLAPASVLNMTQAQRVAAVEQSIGPFSAALNAYWTLVLGRATSVGEGATLDQRRAALKQQTGEGTAEVDARIQRELVSSAGVAAPIISRPVTAAPTPILIAPPVPSPAVTPVPPRLVDMTIAPPIPSPVRPVDVPVVSPAPAVVPAALPSWVVPAAVVGFLVLRRKRRR